MLAPEEVVTTELRDKLVVAALALGQARTPVSMLTSEGAEREGVRGYLWLPDEVEADFEHGGLPWNGDDVVVVADGLDFNRDELMQRQRWAALRMGRARGKEYKRSTLRKYGAANRTRFADRLVTDLAAFFNDDDAVEQFVLSVVPHAAQQERFRHGAYVSAPLQRRLRAAAEPLRRVPPYYPSHLTSLMLAEGRELAPYSPEHRAALVDAYYYDLPVRRNRLAESAWTVLERERRLVILGDPGSGKSTIARAAVLRALAVSERAIAVFVPAPLLARGLEAQRRSGLEILADIALSSPFDPAPDDAVRELAGLLQSSASALVVVDGLDEVTQPGLRLLVDDALDALASLRLRIAVTSRVVGYEPRAGWVEMLAQPLRDFDSLLQHWYGDTNPEAQARGREAYEGNDVVEELVKSPVMAGLVAARAADPSAGDSSDHTALYAWALTALCERDWKRPQHPKRSGGEVVALLAAYEQTAWQLSGGDTLVGASWWDSSTSYRELHEHGIDAELVLNGDLLVAYGAPSSSAQIDVPWLWLHRSFADYLVGRRLARLWEARDFRLELILQRAFQFRNAWQDALRFFVQSLEFSDRQAVLDGIQTFARTGDPGGVIAHTARDAFEGLLPDADDPARLYTRDELLARPGLVPLNIDDLSDEQDQVEVLRAYVAAAPERLSGHEHEWIHLNAPRAYAVVIAEQIRDRKGAPPAVKSVRSEQIEGDDPILEPFWEGFTTKRFPDNLPYGLALEIYLLDYYELDEESELTFWAVNRIERAAPPVPKRLRAGKKLLRRVLAGEWGDWGAFTVAHLEPELAASDLERLSAHARVGYLLSSFRDDSFNDAPSPAKAEPLGLETPEAVAVAADFAVTDIDNINTVEQLVRALRALAHTTDSTAIDALIRLRHRLGPEPGWEWGNRFATSSDDLRSFVRASVASTLADLDEDTVVRQALKLRDNGEVWHWWAVPDPDASMPEDDELRVEVLVWVAEQDLLRLEAHAEAFIILYYSDVVGVLERVPTILHGAPEYLRASADALSDAGELPVWRDRLLAIERGNYAP